MRTKNTVISNGLTRESDFTCKNICEIFGPAGYIRTTYSYAPFGFVTESGDVSQPFQWSSEHYDSELDLVYYNYRHYSPTLGRFLSRDPIEEQGGRNLYAFVKNAPTDKIDRLGYETIDDFESIVGEFIHESVYTTEWESKKACCISCGLSSSVAAAAATVVFAYAQIKCSRKPLAFFTCMIGVRVAFADALKKVKENDRKCKEWCNSRCYCTPQNPGGVCNGRN